MFANHLNDLPKSIALVHEWFSSRSFGGAEQVVHEIDKLISSNGSSAELFALVETVSARKDSWLFGRKIKTSII